ARSGGAGGWSGAGQRQFLRTVMLLMGAATALITAVTLAAPGWVASSTGLGMERSGMVRWLAVPVVFLSAMVFLSAVLNARGEIGRLSLGQMAAPAAMALLAYPVAR